VSAFAQTPTGDLDISTGNLVVRSDLPQVTAWKLSNLFGLFKGEWFRDSRVGVPYFQYVLVQNPSLPIIGSIFKRVCMSAPGVASVTSMGLNFIARTRQLNATIAIATNDGAVLTGGPDSPFIIAQIAPGA
jgi:hypothetical protein